MINHHQNFQLLVDVGWWMLTNNFSSAWPAEKSVHHLAVLLQQPRRQSQAQIQQRWHAYGDVWPWTNDRVEIWSVKHSETHWTILGTRSTWIPQVDHGRPWSHVAWNLTNRLQEGLHCLASRTLQIRFQRFHGSPWISSLATQTLCLEKNAHRKYRKVTSCHIYSSKCGHIYSQFDKASRMDFQQIQW
jgi:hypothetical protein